MTTASPVSPLLRPPSRSISQPNGPQVIQRPRGLSNRTPSQQNLRVHTVPQSAAEASAHDGPSPTGLARERATSIPPATTSSATMQRHRSASATSASQGRKRSSSIVSVQEIKETYDEMLDQEALANINADWVNFKGAWVIHIVLLIVGKILVDIVPGMNQTISWTIVLQLYMLLTFLMFHWVTGTPFSANGGAFDRLTFWEQIDHGAQNTPTRKFLMSLPIGLFLLTTHYVRYDLHPTLFTINLVSLLLFALAPKLPQAHRVRLRFFDNIEIPSGASHASLRTPSRPGTPASRRSPSPVNTNKHTSPKLTESNIKALEPRTVQPILEESEPRTPVDNSGTPTHNRRWKLNND